MSVVVVFCYVFFFFQAEDGIRDLTVTGVQTCALPIFHTGAMGLPSLLVVLVLGVEVFRPLRELRVVLHQGMLGLSAAGGIRQILEAQPRVSDRVTPLLDAASLSPIVAFEDVRFSYPGGRRVAHDGLSFEV